MEKNPKRFFRLEIGHKSNSLNLRFLVSSIGSVTPKASANNADVYNIFCVGMEAKMLGLLKSLVIDLETEVVMN